jgi:ATP-dependent Clp protease ATP-binding subunit ClpC
MITRRYPVLLWTDSAGHHSGTIVNELETPAASAATRTEVLRQLRELIEWNLQNEPWVAEPELQECRLVEVRVDVRPQYQSGQRFIPCPETIPMLVPCVVGMQESGLPLCVIPHFSVQFTFQSNGDLKGLVAHYVKEALRSLTPSQVALRIPPANCQLDEIVLRQKVGAERRPQPESRADLKVLFTVADPLLQDRQRASASSAAYERDPLVARLQHLLTQEKTSLVLVGDPGSGKSTVLLDAVRKLSRNRTKDTEPSDDEASDLSRYRFWRGTGARIIAGMRYLGEWEERCEEFIRQLAAIDGVFCVENLLELVSVGGQGPANSVAAFLLPYLQRGEIRIVGEASPAELEACRRLLPGLLDICQPVHVPSFTEPEVDRVLTRIAETRASSAGLSLRPGFVSRVHRMFRRFQPYSAFPGPAAAFIRTLTESRRRSKAPNGHVELTDADAVSAFVRDTGLPELFLRDDLPLDTHELSNRFASQVIGQPAAAEAATRLVAAIKTGLNDPGRPLGVLLFCGPTGVGKTALARTLVDFCFGGGQQKDRLVRLDMSEYSGWGAARRLLLDSQGRPSPWIERVRRQPFCVVLFDEIEKAAPEVFDVLLGLLDEGRLTDRFGRVTWFRSAVIILTSNLGAESARGMGFTNPGETDYAGEVARFFRPEFFNRLDEVITFHALSTEHIEAITRKELQDLAAREGLAAAGLHLTWSESVVQAVARAGYDRQLGARPLQRTLETLVAIPIARWRVAHPHPAPGILHLDCTDDGSTLVTHQPDPAKQPTKSR